MGFHTFEIPIFFMRIILSLSFLFVFSYSYAQFFNNANMQNAYSHILHLEFSSAKEFLESEKLVNPNNGLIILNENYIDFLKILLSEEEVFFKQAKKNKYSRIYSLSSNDKNSPYYLFAQAEVHLQWALTRIKFKEYLQATYELQKAYRLLEKNTEKFPDFFLNDKSLGVLHILIGSIPKSYSWITNIIGVEGTVSSGFSKLYNFLEFTENNKGYGIYKSEILFLLSFLEMNMNNEPSLYQKLVLKIGDSYKKSDLMKFCLSRLYTKLGNNKKSLEILEYISEDRDSYYFPYLNYLKGMSKLYNLELLASEKYFKSFLDSFRGRNYIKSAYNKLAIIAFLNNKESDRLTYDSLTIKLGFSIIDEDVQSYKSALNNINHNKDMLESRLLYDGGYFVRARNILFQIDTLSFKSENKLITEYYYRLARVSQALNEDYFEVIKKFEKVLSINNNDNLYFHPMSNLQIALLYEQNGNKNKAQEFFKKTLEYKGFNYSNGIYQGATSGLSRLAESPN